MRTTTIQTKSGWLAAAWTDAGLAGLVLPRQSPNEALEKLAFKLKNAPPLLPAPEPPRSKEEKTLVHDIERYFRGEAVNFSATIDWSGYTNFQRRVLSIVKLINYSEVCSYQQVAQKAGSPRAARAVGGVMRSNRTPLVIPCHRVIAADGSLGGFSDSLDMKRYLLGLEKARL